MTLSAKMLQIQATGGTHFLADTMSEAIIPGSNEGMLGYDMGSVIHGEGAVTNLDFHR